MSADDFVDVPDPESDDEDVDPELDVGDEPDEPDDDSPDDADPDEPSELLADVSAPDVDSFDPDPDPDPEPDASDEPPPSDDDLEERAERRSFFAQPDPL